MRPLLVALALCALPASAATGPRAFGKAYERVEPSVVVVEASQGAVVRHGGGFVASTDGHVVCASYTVERARTVRVHVRGEWKPARVIAIDNNLRVALLKIDGTGLKPVAVAAQPELKEGTWIVAVERGVDGKPHGMAGTVASSPPARNRPSVALVDAPSMAGSPLVNLHGEVVGMSLGRITQRRGRATALAPLREFLKRAAAQP